MQGHERVHLLTIPNAALCSHCKKPFDGTFQQAYQCDGCKTSGCQFRFDSSNVISSCETPNDGCCGYIHEKCVEELQCKRIKQ